MPVVRSFKGIRPKKEIADKVSCLPYDVMNREEAKEMGKDEKSFLHIIRSEIDLDDSIDVHDDRVYEKARENFDKFIEKGYLIQDEEPCYYIYRQIMNGRVQTGICGCCSIDDYESGIIKKHEFTRPEKEEDRINNFLACSAHTEPVFFAYRKNNELKNIIDNHIKNNESVYDFTSDDNIRHILWVVDDKDEVKSIADVFEKIDCLYIADGHHRTASSYRVGKMKREELGKGGEYDYILSVIFDSDELEIMDYNRVVYDLNGYTLDEFLEKIKDKFEVEKKEDTFKPDKVHSFGMYVDGSWYELRAKEGTFEDNPVNRLDADILQKNLLAPILGIDDPRTSKRIDFVGGIRGMDELKKRVDERGEGVAFAVHPVSIEDLFDVADANMIMPPKSTWFEPKLRSGLFIHEI